VRLACQRRGRKRQHISKAAPRNFDSLGLGNINIYTECVCIYPGVAGLNVLFSLMSLIIGFGMSIFAKFGAERS